MKKSSYSTLIIFLVFSIVGLALIPRLSIQLNPSQKSSSLTISYSWSSASPEIIENQVSTKLEGMLNNLQGIQKVSSVSGYGKGSITIDIDKASDIDQLRFEAASIVRQLYPQLPKEVSYPTISLNSPQQESLQKPLISLQLNGNSDRNELKVYAEEKIKPKLTQIKGINSVNVYGGNRQEWVLTYDRRQLENLQLSENDIIKSIKSRYDQSSLGIAHNGEINQMNVILGQNPQFTSSGKTAEEIKRDLENITLPCSEKNAISGSRILHLSDILKVIRSEQNVEEFYRINSKNAITVVIHADIGVNQLNLSKVIRSKLDEITQTLPPSYQATIEYDATVHIRENLDKIWVQSGLAIFILLIFVWLSTRSLRYSMLILLSLIVTLSLSSLIFFFLKIELHLYSLAAITTSLGILIDNTIVIIDHYCRYKNLKVFTALLGATITTISGLIVIWFLPDNIKFNLLDFAVVMIIVLMMSLIVALLFIPSLIDIIKLSIGNQPFKQKNKFKVIVKLTKVYTEIIEILLRFRKISFTIMLLSFGLPVFLLPNHLEKQNTFSRYYNSSIGSEYYQENIQPILSKVLGGSLRLFINYVYEKSYSTTKEPTTLYVNAGLPNNATIEQMNGLYLQVERFVSQFKEISQFITRVPNGQNGSMTIYFKPEYENGGFPYMLKNQLISFSTEMSGISWNIYGVGQGFSQHLNESNVSTFNVTMKGYNYDELKRQAIVLKKQLEINPKVQEVNINKNLNLRNDKNLYELVLETNPQHLVFFGISNEELYQYLQRQNIHSHADIYQLMNGEYEQIKVIPDDSKYFDVWSLMNQPVMMDKKVIKLSSLSKAEMKNISSEIHKENQEYIRMVSFEYFGSQTLGDKFLEKTLKTIKSELPLGYTVQKTGYDRYSDDSKQQYFLIGLVILLIYLFCAIIFESFLQPLALILLIPISYIGVFITFYWFDLNFDQGGYASLLLLSGNVVCAAIFIISEFNNLKQLYPRKESFKLYIKAYNHKIIPILLTIFSTVVGLVPFLIFGQNEVFWFALGVGTIGGLIMSLIAIILCLPLFLRFRSS